MRVSKQSTPPVTNDSSTASSEMDTLLLRIRELEARLQESENTPPLQEQILPLPSCMKQKKLATPIAVIMYCQFTWQIPLPAGR